MAHDVFISYSTHDKQIADALCAKLEADRIRCWIAPRDVLPGVEYAKALAQAITDSKILVLVLSASSNESKLVLREVERAVSRGIPILPFRIENIELSESMEFYVSTQHWLDALTPPLEIHLEKLAKTIRTLLPTEDQEALSTKPVEHKIENAIKKGRASWAWPANLKPSFIGPILLILVVVVAGLFGYILRNPGQNITTVESDKKEANSDKNIADFGGDNTGKSTQPDSSTQGSSTGTSAAATNGDNQTNKLYESSVLCKQAHDLSINGGDPIQILDLCNRAIQLNPSNYRAYEIRATNYQTMNQLNEALADVSTAIRLDPGAGNHYLHQGRIYVEMGNNSAAIESFRKTLDIVRENPDASGANDYKQKAEQELNRLGVSGY
ncbi:MAG: TIR domain-containing protein [Syntrophomonadaceae bacterium]